MSEVAVFETIVGRDAARWQWSHKWQDTRQCTMDNQCHLSHLLRHLITNIIHHLIDQQPLLITRITHHTGTTTQCDNTTVCTAGVWQWHHKPTTAITSLNRGKDKTLKINVTMLPPWHRVDTLATLRYIANNTHFMSCIIHLCKFALRWHFLAHSEVSNSDCKLSYVNKRRGTRAWMAVRNVTGRSSRSFDIICQMHWFYCHLSGDFILGFLSQTPLLMHKT